MQLEKSTSHVKNVISHEIGRLESFGEAVANVVTHGLGILLSVLGLVVMLYYASLQHDFAKIVSAALFGASLIITYASSTLYHSFPHTVKAKRYFRIMDHSAIFFLIAGSYTPFTLVTLNGRWGWALLAVIWGFALFGITFKLIFKHRYEAVSLALYLIMGWLVIFVIKPIWEKMPGPGLIWLVAGGLFYTVGTIFYARKKPYNHTVWHVFVLGGSICHFFAILFYVIKI